MPEWFVVQCNPQREDFVCERLESLDPYAPKFKNQQGRIRPLFPGYVFIPATENWSPIQNTFGVRTILKSGDHPAKLADIVVANWRNMERNGLVLLPDPPRFRQGERLVVLKGTLRNRVVLHTGLSAKDREFVLLDMLGQMIKLNIASDDLVSEIEKTTRDRLRQRRETLMRLRKSVGA